MQNTVPETVADNSDDSILGFELSLCVKKRNHIKTPTRRPTRNVPLSSTEEDFRRRIRNLTVMWMRKIPCIHQASPCSPLRYQQENLDTSHHSIIDLTGSPSTPSSPTVIPGSAGCTSKSNSSQSDTSTGDTSKMQ